MVKATVTKTSDAPDDDIGDDDTTPNLTIINLIGIHITTTIVSGFATGGTEFEIDFQLSSTFNFEFSDSGFTNVNVRSWAAADNYLEDSVFHADGNQLLQPWDRLIRDLWETMRGLLGPFRGMPFQPSGKPENWRFNGVSAYDRSGYSVSGAGDVNGDGLDDLIVGAHFDDPNGGQSGASFVVFGKADGTAVELSDVEQGIGGFVINGVSADDLSGFSVSSAGDVNGDGLDDLIVGAGLDDPNGTQSGASFVVFGKADGGVVELSDIEAGIGGFVINGVSAGDQSGRSVSSAGDVNGDGLDDLIVSAFADDPNGLESGASFLVFGKADGSAVELSDVEQGIGGFVINGVSAGDLSGISVSSAGDVNGDGFADLIVGAPTDSPNGTSSGASFVVFGGDFTGSVDILGTSGADVLVGTAADEIIIAAQGDDTITGGGGDDRLTGALGNDTFIFANGSGNDTIVDFTPGAGPGDVLDISAFGFVNLAEIQAASTQVGDDVVIALDGNDSVTLLNVLLADLHADDFIF
ncbi:MAG: FG-GAP repeat protein [Proteobacteria bacterium]|nr:FG-GAP repeat protein [Pseudomonadota bacterium]